MPVLLLPGGTNPAGAPSLQPPQGWPSAAKAVQPASTQHGHCALGLCQALCRAAVPPGVSALLRGCVAAAGGSCKEPLPLSTDPEAKGRARHASWVALGSARLAGEGWEFLKASGVALKRFNL